MTNKTVYKGHYLSANATPEADGGHRARAAVMSLDNGATRWQRFLDFGVFPCSESARAHALSAGKEWIDSQLKRDASPAFSALPSPRGVRR